MKKEARPRRLRALAGAVTALAAFSPSAVAQFGPAQRPPIVIRGGTVHIGDGDVIQNGTVILRGREIEAVGVGLTVPEGANVIDAVGRHVYPGLIDVESTLLLDDASRVNGEGNAASAITDALDWFDRHAYEQAWAGGVTTIGIASRRALVDGPRAVVKMRRARGDDAILRKDGDLGVTFGLNGIRPSMRLREWKTLFEQLDATKKYIESWDEYAEKLEEYKKALEKSAKEGEKVAPGDKKEKEEATPKPEAPAPGDGTPRGQGERRRGPRPNPRGHHDHDTPFMRWLQDTLGWVCDCGLPSRENPGHDHEPSKLTLVDGVSFAEEPAKPEGETAKDGAKADEPKKPARPAKDLQREALKRALEGKSGVNVYVSAAADIVNLLELLRTYPLKATITGAGELAQVADELAAAGVSVVVVQSHQLGDDAVSTAAKLDAAGVSIALTTAGHTPAATRWLSLSAAAAVAGGLDKERALAAITSRAAAVLGVADRVGTLAVGRDADVVITQGELFSSTAVIEHVFIDGRNVRER
ncbi:MAG: hypothetical protein EXS13_12330 [Planctomycetes bacterium]|nr:hypothetical protein [Planctomycetota bacterium]